MQSEQRSVMPSKCLEILEEWEGGCFYTDELLAEAYTTFLPTLLEEVGEVDVRAIAFLKAGFEAYLREQDGADTDAALTHRMALAMVGGRVATRSTQRPATPEPVPRSATPEQRPAAPEPRSATPRPAPPPHSPQPGPSKRPREEADPDDAEVADEEVAQPTLEVLQTRERELKRFKAMFREEVMLIKGLGASLPSEELMEGMFDAVLHRQKEAVQATDDDRVILEIQNGENADNPLWFSMRRVDQLSGRVILDKLTRVLNSNQSFMLGGQLKVCYIYVPTPEGGGRRPRRLANETLEEWLARLVKLGTIYSPDNTIDQMCLARAVAVAKAHGCMHKQAFYKMKQNNSVPQRKEALSLCQAAQIDPQQPCGLDEVRKLQAVLPAYRVCVYTDRAGKECVFKGEYSLGARNLYLLLHNGHFHAILHPKQAFCFEHVCDKCVTFFNNKGEHKCKDTCERCSGPHMHDGPLTRCPDCHHYFAGDECLDTHKTLKLPQSDVTKCEAFKFCTACETSYSTLRNRKHICGFVYCKFCKQNVPENHLCYMQPWGEKEKKKDFKYLTVYYDIETTQCDPVEGRVDTFEHKPNLLVVHTVCDQCRDVPQNNYFCTVCRNRQNIFHNLDDPNLNVMGQFFDYLQSFQGKYEILLVAHNARSFDGIFALQEVIARKMKPQLILQGAKIICMKVGSWKFIDSLMFLTMPLSAMPKSFGLSELKKGYWPFLANKPEYYNYEGPMLDKDFYCVPTMKAKAAREFNQWYDEQVAQNYAFNFRRELIDYCVSDVTILRQGCSAFRTLFTELAGFDPMMHCITLSAACMAAYRRNFLPPGKIGMVPDGGYHGRGKQSHIALQWLDFESHKLGQKIKTIYTEREVYVMGRPVDGYAEIPRADGSVERRIFQFHGDYFHQCPKHYPVTEKSGENRYENTVRLTALFRRAGYTVIEKWECEFREEMQSNPEVKAYYAAHPTTRTPPLVLRDALMGGRTSALRCYLKADLSKGEKIKMVDVVSEYPNANLRGMYPYGHPTIYLEGDPDMPLVHQWNGVIKCTVLPPRDLFVPVLPYKTCGKLMFPLCRTCADTEGKDLCRHEDPALRQLTHTWCAPELQLAVQKGYQVVTVHEVYQYPGTMQYDPEAGVDGLLSAYVRRVLSVKIQASGWPSDCDTEEKRQQYVADIKKYDGIEIDPDKVEKNPGLRTVGKFKANSFWGKLGEKSLRPKTILIYNYEELMGLVTDPLKEVTSLLPLGEDCLQLTWKPVEEAECTLPTMSLVHAAFTTCLGRIQLYKYLDVVKERGAYHDTDSVAYLSRPGEPDLPLGTHLGDLTDQVEEDYGPGSYITEIVAGGPKNYTYKVAVGGDLQNIVPVIKVRGITHNLSCDQIVTFDNMKAMVLGERDPITIPIPRQIARLPSWKIVTRPTSKKWQAINTKRRRVDVERTVPHGYNAFANQPEEDQELLENMDILME